MDKAEIVVALSCGGRKNEKWDPTDQALAIHASDAARKLGVPIMAQWEVADLLPPSSRAVFTVRAHRESGRWLDTREVMEQIKEECNVRFIDHIALVAHRIHAPRAKRVAEKLGFSVSIISTEHAELDPDSAYWWVRYDWLFWFYETFLSKPVYRFRGWI